MTDHGNMNEAKLASKGVGAPDGRFEGPPGRRTRKRNWRIVAIAQVIAILIVAVAIPTSVAALTSDETSVVPAVDATGPAETGPAETGPTALEPTALELTALELTAGGPDEQDSATCQGVQPPARGHLELTQMADGIKARFVLHQMTTPGHLWRIVLKHADLTGCCAGPDRDDFDVVFEDTVLATGDSGDITVQHIIRGVRTGFVKAKARDRQTGQLCIVRAWPLV
jgi:hypothetical protein